MSDSGNEARAGNSNARRRRILLIAVPLVAAATALGFYFRAGRYQSTDDAYVQAARVQVSTDVGGRIVAIDVHDNQHVAKGQVLFRLEQRPFLIAVADAEAKLAGTLPLAPFMPMLISAACRMN